MNNRKGAIDMDFAAVCLIACLTVILIGGFVYTEMKINRNYGMVTDKRFIPAHSEVVVTMETIEVGDDSYCVPSSETRWVPDEWIVTLTNETGEFRKYGKAFYDESEIGKEWRKYKENEEVKNNQN
jgi:hypothetical protein